MAKHSALRILGGLAALAGFFFSAIILLALLPSSRYGCSLYDIFFSDKACSSSRSLIMFAIALLIAGVACMIAVVVARNPSVARASSVVGVVYFILTAALFFFGVAGSLAGGMH
jgi:hypothetical protein